MVVVVIVVVFGVEGRAREENAPEKKKKKRREFGGTLLSSARPTTALECCPCWAYHRIVHAVSREAISCILHVGEMSSDIIYRSITPPPPPNHRPLSTVHPTAALQVRIQQEAVACLLAGIVFSSVLRSARFCYPPAPPRNSNPLPYPLRFVLRGWRAWKAHAWRRATTSSGKRGRAGRLVQEA